jgi:pimeloyl-ACP methyl ester carboxylesterase
MMGQEDLLFPIEACEEAASKMPMVSKLVLPGAAHAIHFEKPHSFIDGLRQFLRYE